MITSEQLQISHSAEWTPDGRQVLLLGGISIPSMASQGFRGRGAQLYSITLNRIEKHPDDRDINTEEQALAALNEPGAGRGGRGAPGAAPRVDVTIDWDGMERRFRRLSTMTVSTVVPAPDSRTYAFMAGGGAGAAEGAGGPGLYIINDDGSRLTRLNTTIAGATGAGGRGGRGGGGGGFGGNEPQWARDGRSIYMMLGGGIYAIAVPTAGTGDAAQAAAAPGGG